MKLTPTTPKPFIIFTTLLLISLTLNTNAQQSPTPATPSTLRVLCYNIHFGQGMDDQYNIQRLANVINKLKPDLVALQEVDVGVLRSGRVHQVRQLGKLTNMASRYGPTQHYQGGLYGNAILTRLPILDVAIHPLPYTEATDELTTYPRGAIALTVQRTDGSPLRFISTHFQHNLEPDRIAQATRINELFASDNTTPSIPTILAGDMNAKPDSEPMQILLQSWTNAINTPALPTAPSNAPRSRIDYILYQPGPTLKATQTQVINEPMASDHLPVFAIFQ